MERTLTVRLAQPADDAGIVELMSKVVMPGKIAMSYCYKPSFFSALEAEGHNVKVVVGEQAGIIVGVGTITTRKVYLQGNPIEIGYLASLRLTPELRGGPLLARGYHLFQELHRKELRLPFYLTSIMRSNSAIRSVLTSGKGGLPDYRFLAGYKTAVLPVLRKYAPQRGFTMVRGDEAGIDAVFTCFERYGRKKNFFTVYEREDWLNSKGMLKGMRPEDFIVAFSGPVPVGVVALWDQSSYKKLVVRDFSGSMEISSGLAALIGKLTGRPILPVKNAPFAPVYLSCVAVKDNDSKVFSALLTEALNRMRERKKMLLVAGLFESDVWWSVINSYWHLPYYSDIYTVNWYGDRSDAVGPESEKYLDAGSL